MQIKIAIFRQALLLKRETCMTRELVGMYGLENVS